MTTIAYHHNDKQVAVDSRIVGGGIINSDSFDKTIKNELGLWFFCGSASDIVDLQVLKHNDEINPIPDCTAFLITSGKCYLVGVNSHGFCQYLELTYNDTNGSGADLALASMDHGKSAKEAVEYAITRDIYSGGKVRVFDVETGNLVT